MFFGKTPRAKSAEQEFKNRIPGSIPGAVKVIILFLLSAFLLLESFQRHSGIRTENWEKEIYCDKAGYYIYLPAVFIYHFKPEKFPDKIVEKSGGQFSFENNKINTKFPYGVSLLWAPFFIHAHLIASVFKLNPDGYSTIYQKMIDVAAVFYLIIGLIFLFRFLKYYFDEITISIGLLFLLFGTNLLYYSVDETGMSHVYSFALFSILLYYFRKFSLETENKKQYKYFIISSICVALIIIVRNFNAVFLPFVFLWDINNFRSLEKRFLKVLNVKMLITFFLIIIIFLLPQMIYWKYSYGHFIVFSYEGESFMYWKNPKLLELLFAPRNGIMLYTPIVVFLMAGAIFMIIKRKQNGIFIFMIFIVHLYLYASWQCWSLGSAFGNRSIVDILPFIVFPLMIILSYMNRIYKKIVLYFILTLFTIYSLNIFSMYRKNFYGADDWDWCEYEHMVCAGDYFTFVFGKNFFKEKDNGIITLRASNGQYVCVEPDDRLFANRSKAGEWERFKVIKIDAFKCAFKSFRNFYVCSCDLCDNALIANRKKRDIWEVFDIVKSPDLTVSLRSHTGKFVSAVLSRNGQLVANKDRIGDEEKFKVDTIK